MNTVQLILKNMRQRALSTTLTLLSVLLGVALAIGILIIGRESENLFAQRDFGYELIVGPPKGSPLQLTLNTVYHMDVSPGVIPYAVYEDLSRKTPAPAGRNDYRRYVKYAVPTIVGDSVGGHRVVGTSPLMFGVDDDGKPVADTTNEDGETVSNRFQYRKGKSYAFAQGRAFAPRKFEAVVGADAARELHLHLYDPSKSEEDNLKDGGAFRVTHGMPGPNDTPDVHKPRWRIVGILQETGTANDRVLFVPFISLYAIAEHEDGMIQQALLRSKLDLTKLPPDQREAAMKQMGVDVEKLAPSMRAKLGLSAPSTAPAANAPVSTGGGELMTDAAPAKPAAAKPSEEEDPDAYVLDANGDIVPNLPQDQWELSAIFVKARGGETAGFSTTTMLYNFKVIDDRATAVSPASVMREFFDTFLKGSTQVLLAVSVLVTVVAGASIATTIYNSVSARLREIAILRALGATKGRILTLICGEAVVIGIVAALLGLIVGHGAAAVASRFFKASVGESINWLPVGRTEVFWLAGVVALAFVAGLVPAMKAYRTPVATNLQGG